MIDTRAIVLLLSVSAASPRDSAAAGAMDVDKGTTGASADMLVPWGLGLVDSSRGAPLKPTGRVLSPVVAALGGNASFYSDTRRTVMTALATCGRSDGDVGCYVLGPFDKVRYLGMFRKANDRSETPSATSSVVLVSFIKSADRPQEHNGAVQGTNVVPSVKIINVPEEAFARLSKAIHRQLKEAKYQKWMQAGTDGVTYTFHGWEAGYGNMFGYVWNPLSGFGGGIVEAVDALIEICEKQGRGPGGRDVPLASISHVVDRLSVDRVEIGPDLTDLLKSPINDKMLETPP